MTHQELAMLYGTNKKFYVNEQLLTPEETRSLFSFPHATITTNKTYVVCDEEFDGESLGFVLLV
jgi:hypothetical protein